MLQIVDSTIRCQSSSSRFLTVSVSSMTPYSCIIEHRRGLWSKGLDVKWMQTSLSSGLTITAAMTLHATQPVSAQRHTHTHAHTHNLGLGLLSLSLLPLSLFDSFGHIYVGKFDFALNRTGVSKLFPLVGVVQIAPHPLHLHRDLKATVLPGHHLGQDRDTGDVMKETRKRPKHGNHFERNKSQLIWISDRGQC